MSTVKEPEQTIEETTARTLAALSELDKMEQQLADNNRKIANARADLNECEINNKAEARKIEMRRTEWEACLRASREMI